MNIFDKFRDRYPCRTLQPKADLGLIYFFARGRTVLRRNCDIPTGVIHRPVPAKPGMRPPHSTTEVLRQHRWRNGSPMKVYRFRGKA